MEAGNSPMFASPFRAQLPLIASMRFLKMNHTIPKESVIVDGEVYAQHVAINQNYYHPTGEFIPLSAEEKQQTLLHRWSRIVRRFAMSPALEEGDRRVSYVAFNT